MSSQKNKGRPKKTRCPICLHKSQKCRGGCQPLQGPPHVPIPNSFDSNSGFRYCPSASSARTAPSRIRPAVGKDAYPKQVAKATAKEDKAKEKKKVLKEQDHTQHQKMGRTHFNALTSLRNRYQSPTVNSKEYQKKEHQGVTR
jgi:hypothetical protein